MLGQVEGGLENWVCKMELLRFSAEKPTIDNGMALCNNISVQGSQETQPSPPNPLSHYEEVMLMNGSSMCSAVASPPVVR